MLGILFSGFISMLSLLFHLMLISTPALAARGSGHSLDFDPKNFQRIKL